MSHFRLIHSGLDVAPLLAQLDAAPDLWDEHTERRTAPGSPHAEMRDIWLRTRPRDELQDDEAFQLPYWPVFYPAWRRLPAVQPIVHALMGMTQAVQLGNVLITRLPPGGVIRPHVDGGWAAVWFNRKFYCCLRGGARCVNTWEGGEEVAMRPGEIFEFANDVVHGVENHDSRERISLIVTLRVEG